jgi:hypothetical protein
MDTRRPPTLPDLEEATAHEIEDALLRFDELDVPSREKLATHPVEGRRLSRLLDAEQWLAEEATAEDLAACACPTSEELFDFGGGPGSGSLSVETEKRIGAHLSLCDSCRELLSTLSQPPPLPLEISEQPTLSIRRPRRRPHQLVLLAVAASLLGVVVIPGLFTPDPLSELPRTPIYRGMESANLLFPRGPILARDEGGATPEFSLAETPGASRYRVDVFRHDGGAFESGLLVASLLDDGPRVVGGELSPGRYTWRAWATVDGLERKLGARDFEIRSNSALENRLLGLGDESSVTEVVEVVRALHEAGFLTDARVLARTLPESAEAEAYLRPPGR